MLTFFVNTVSLWSYNKIYHHIVISFERINAFVYLFEYLINDVNVFESCYDGLAGSNQIFLLCYCIPFRKKKVHVSWAELEQNEPSRLEWLTRVVSGGERLETRIATVRDGEFEPHKPFNCRHRDAATWYGDALRIDFAPQI